MGRNLKNLRKYYGYSRQDVANMIGLSFYAIREYEQGNREPNITTLIKLANVFNCSIDYLVGKDMK
ncbi:MAG: helix-turn-helix domain-containing protein [Bacillota bacterium]|nr:helix-turn-helix domain-containing protein [Bacillota bacterium]